MYSFRKLPCRPGIVRTIASCTETVVNSGIVPPPYAGNKQCHLIIPAPEVVFWSCQMPAPRQGKETVPPGLLLRYQDWKRRTIRLLQACLFPAALPQSSV